jgi:colanic acid biosynthesis glycosyl transferase WcaI
LECLELKFLILTQYFPPEVGASQTRLAALAQQLKHCGHSVEIVTTFPNYPTGSIFPAYRRRWMVSETQDGILIHRTWIYASTGAGIKRIAGYLSFAATAFLGLWKCAKPDWIFVESPPPTLALTALLAAKLWRVPVIVNIADLWPDSISALGLIKQSTILNLLLALEAFVYKHATIVNAVTDGIRRRLIEEKKVDPARITFLPNGVDTDVFIPLPPNHALKHGLNIFASHIVLYAGTHGYAHALDHALDCAKILAADNIHFLFVGDGSEKARLMQRAKELHLTNVTFCDPVAPADIPQYLSMADCGLVPQKKIPLFEGNRPAKTFVIMACARPVVFSGQGEGAQLIEQAQAGLVVPPENPQAMAEAIRRIVASPALKRELGENGRDFVCKNLRWSVLIKNWLEELRISASVVSR